MQFKNEKVIEINGKRYCSIEKVLGVEDNKEYVVLRQVKLETKNYTHPLNGPIEQMEFCKINYRTPCIIELTKWEEIEDINSETKHKVIL